MPNLQDCNNKISSIQPTSNQANLFILFKSVLLSNMQSAGQFGRNELPHKPVCYDLVPEQPDSVVSALHNKPVFIKDFTEGTLLKSVSKFE